MVQINNFTGFETQGLEETNSAAGTPTFETINQRTGGSALILDDTAEEYDFPWVADGITDAGDDYVIGFAFRKSANAADIFLRILDDAAGLVLRLNLLSGGDIEFRNSGGSLLDTSAVLNSDQWYYFEIYFENTNTGAWEWFQDGVSIGSGTSDFQPAASPALGASSLIKLEGIATVTLLFDDVYILSGATAATDRLGGGTINEMPEVFMYQNDRNEGDGTADLSAISGGGLTLNSGEWTDAANTPGSEASSADFTGTPLDGVAYADGGARRGPANLTGDTYYFDTSDAGPRDNDSVWTNDANGFDGSISTLTRSTTSGTFATNELQGEGTTAPSSGGTIGECFARIYAEGDDSDDEVQFVVLTDGEAETALSSRAFAPGTVARWSPWFAMTEPGGGWTFAVIQALETTFWGSSDATFNGIDVYRVEIFIEHTSGSETWDRGTIVDGDANIKAVKGIWHAERGGGGATTHTIYIGNDADSEGGFDSTTITLLNNTEADFEFLGETDPPLSTENFAQGFGVSGNQDFRCREMWATLLHVPSAADDADVDAGILIGGEQQPLIKPGGMVPY